MVLPEDLVKLCAQVDQRCEQLFENDFQEHSQWLSEIVEETRKQLWGDDEPEGADGVSEPGSPPAGATGAEPFLLPRTPSMKRRRRGDSGQARLAALNASLLDTSGHGRSRRAASRVAAFKMALTQQQMNVPARKMRRPRSSCVRAEHQLMEQVRRGGLRRQRAAKTAAAEDSETWEDDDEASLQEPAAPAAPVPAPRTPRTPRTLRSPYVNLPDKPAVKAMVRAYEALASPAVERASVPVVPSPPLVGRKQTRAKATGTDDGPNTPPKRRGKAALPVDTASSAGSQDEDIERPPKRRQTRTKTADHDAKGGLKTPPKHLVKKMLLKSTDGADSQEEEVELPLPRRPTRTNAAVTASAAPVGTERQDETGGPVTPPIQRATRTKVTADSVAVGSNGSEEEPPQTPPDRRLTRSKHPVKVTAKPAAKHPVRAESPPEKRCEADERSATSSVSSVDADGSKEVTIGAPSRRQTRAKTSADSEQSHIVPSQNKTESIAKSGAATVSAASQDLHQTKPKQVKTPPLRRQTRCQEAVSKEAGIQRAPDPIDADAPAQQEHEVMQTEPEPVEVKTAAEPEPMEVKTAAEPEPVEVKPAAEREPVEQEWPQKQPTGLAVSSDVVEHRRVTRTTRAAAAAEAVVTSPPADTGGGRQTRAAASATDPAPPSPPIVLSAEDSGGRRQTRSRAVAAAAETESRRLTRTQAAEQQARTAADAELSQESSADLSQEESSETSPHDMFTPPHKTRKFGPVKPSRTTPQPRRGANIAMPAEGGSFIQRAGPPRPTAEEVEEKRRQELARKREREEEARRKRDLLMKKKVEEERQKREERQQRALEVRRQREEEQRQAHLRKQQARDDRMDAATAATETKRQEEALRKRRQLADKQREVDEKRRQEEEARAARARHLAEEQERRHAELERQQKQREQERLRQREQERAAQEQERRRVEQERAQREREAERIAREKAEMARLAEREAVRRTPAANAAAQPQSSSLNATFTMEEGEAAAGAGVAKAPVTPGPTVVTSYEITPGRDELPPQPLHNPNDYNIGDLCSEDSTDDDSAPRKVIPNWAKGGALKTALIAQAYRSISSDQIFPPDELFPDVQLEKIFKVARRAFFKRTSSAQWDTPPGNRTAAR